MTRRSPESLHQSMKTSPWLVLGSTMILLIVVIVLAVQNTNREKGYMSKLLSAKGAALIRAVEAGARTGMMGTSWGGRQIQRLLEETGRLPDVLFMALVDKNGIVVAHNDSSKIDRPFRKGKKLIHMGPDTQENWEVVDLENGTKAFEVHRLFRPLKPDREHRRGRMQGMMHHRGMMPPPADDWFSREYDQDLLIVVGLDIAPFQEAIQADIRTTVVLSVILLVSGFGAFVSLFWMQSYRAAKRSLRDTNAFANDLQAQIRRQEKLAALGGLAAGVAHEIRNPLSSIKGLATFFKDQFADGSEARQAAGVMIQEVDRLNRAISELLDFARPTDLKRRTTMLGPLLNRSIRLIQQDASSRDISITLDIAEDICPVYIDPDRLTQCLLNIYLNAIQAMAPGGTLTVRCEGNAGKNLSIVVSDTGHGIAPDQIAQIFDPYFTTKNKGTGLGLAIVHKIIEAHQGRVDVQSTPNRGTAVTLFLPCDARKTGPALSA